MCVSIFDFVPARYVIFCTLGLKIVPDVAFVVQTNSDRVPDVLKLHYLSQMLVCSNFQT
jgi:hypothetical protein